MTTLISTLPHVFIPLVIIIAAISVLGFLGNAMAFYVFLFRYPSSGFNKLLATLALYDLITCCVHMPLDIATFFPVGMARSHLCKTTCFLLAFTSTGSALVLLSIATVRYRGIHKPLAGLFSSKSASCAIVISVLAAAGIGLPITFLFGEGQLKMDSNTTAEICAVEERFSESVGPITYYFVLAGLYFITLCLHTFLYARCVLTVWNRRRLFVSTVASKTKTKNTTTMTPRIPRGRHNHNHNVSTITPVTVNADLSTSTGCPHNDSVSVTVTATSGAIQQDGGVRQKANAIAHSSPSSTAAANPSWLLNAAHYNSSSRRQVNTNVDNPGKAQHPGIKNKHVPYQNTSSPEIKAYSNASTLPVRGGMAGNNVNQTSYRVLAVVIAISIAYFVSYAPHFAVMFYLFTNDSAVFTESAQSLVFELLMRSFFVNNVLDPVIYGMLSADFRREAKRSLRRLICCVCCRH